MKSVGFVMKGYFFCVSNWSFARSITFVVSGACRVVPKLAFCCVGSYIFVFHMAQPLMSNQHHAEAALYQSHALG